jgi:hypothetical protein
MDHLERIQSHLDAEAAWSSHLPQFRGHLSLGRVGAAGMLVGAAFGVHLTAAIACGIATLYGADQDASEPPLWRKAIVSLREVVSPLVWTLIASNHRVRSLGHVVGLLRHSECIPRLRVPHHSFISTEDAII